MWWACCPRTRRSFLPTARRWCRLGAPSDAPPVIGYVSQACRSPNVGRSIALAVLDDGRRLIDERIEIAAIDRRRTGAGDAPVLRRSGRRTDEGLRRWATRSRSSGPERPALISLRVGARGIPAVERAVGAALPRPAGLAPSVGSVTVFGLGPDEWLIRVAPDEEEGWLARTRGDHRRHVQCRGPGLRRLARLHHRRPRVARRAFPGDGSGPPSDRCFPRAERCAPRSPGSRR